MEVGRRSSSSKNEFRESRSGRKKMGALPLAMVLSFNDKDVHPDCPNVSNPYHKCGRHCLVEIPRGKNFLDALRSDGNQDWEKKSEKMGVNPNCPNASNPYHKCADYCLGKLSEKLQDAGKDQAATKLKGSKEGEKVLYAKTNTGFHPHCKHASNPNHECAESCFQSVTEGIIAQGEKQKEVSNKANKSSMRLNHNASSHNIISETCFEDTPKREHLKGDMKSKKKNEIDLTLQRELSSECRSASNPNHECGEYCIQHVPEREQHGQVIRPKSFQEGEKVMSKKHSEENFKGGFMESDENVHSSPKPAPSPYNKFTEHYFEETSKKGQLARAIKPKEESEIVVSTEQGMNLECKNVSNPEKERFRQTIKNLKEEDIVVHPSERRVSPKCKFGSNPYHVCAQYCLQNAIESEQHGQALMQSKENKEAVFPLERVNPRCKYASNAYHVCAEYCLQNIPNELHPERSEKNAVASTPVVDLDCKHLSNPYNACAEHCSENFLERDPPQKTIKNLKEEDIVVLPSERRVSPECKFASNPYHVCAEYCLQNAIESEQHGQALMQSKENTEAVFPLERVNPQCKYTSNAYHVCAEYCLQIIPNGLHPERSVMKSREEKKVVASTPVMDLDCKHLSNPYNMCAEHCSENFLERDPPQQTIKNLKEEDIVVLPSERRVSPECKFASNPYHVCAEYCLQNAIESEKHGQALMQSKKVKEAVFPLERVNPQCKYASNAYHVCTEYCLQNVPNGRHPERSVMKSRAEKKVVTSTAVVDLDCKHLSNPYNVCAEHCSENFLERDPPQQTIKNLKEEDIVVLPSERRVSPECNFASNPYHVCAEYCLQNAIESEQHGQDERKKEERNACRRDENPKYKNASNFFHRCAEYCPEEISPKNEAVEGSTATVERKKRNSSKENQNREPTDVPPLHDDSTDLFHEWAKYFSQTKVTTDQDEIVQKAKKAGIGESTRRNGKGDCFQNYYGSANMEKVEATRDFPRSLLISLFFLVGFLLGLLRWSRVIYSLVMSSEKNEEPERMKQGRHLDPKCEKVSDPFHNCSHYC